MSNFPEKEYRGYTYKITGRKGVNNIICFGIGRFVTEEECMQAIDKSFLPKKSVEEVIAELNAKGYKLVSKREILNGDAVMHTYFEHTCGHRILNPEMEVENACEEVKTLCGYEILDYADEHGATDFFGAISGMYL